MSVSATEERPRRRLSAPARRALILEAALDAFAANGHGATSMAEIAEAAGVTRAVLYDHFSSKKALFLALLEEQNGIFLGYVAAQIAGEGTAEERMRSTMDAVFSFAEQSPAAWSLLFGNATHGDPEIDAAWRQVFDGRVHAVAALLAADARAADIDPDGRTFTVMVEMLIAALVGAVDAGRHVRGTTRGDLLEAGTALLWRGLSRPSGA